MLYRLRQRLSNEGGFTLIELLVVILIIGILAAIAIPAFLSQTSKASDSAAKTQAGTLQTTMEAYASENNGSFASASTLARTSENRADAERHLDGESQETGHHADEFTVDIRSRRNEKQIHT